MVLFLSNTPPEPKHQMHYFFFTRQWFVLMEITLFGLSGLQKTKTAALVPTKLLIDLIKMF